jgi:TFIIF-interacting CTD phosphatase-like protein
LIKDKTIEEEIKPTSTNNEETIVEIETLDSHIHAKPSIPYLPAKADKIYTLVLDLDETLVHYVEDTDNAYIQIRPGCENFIEEMAQYYELIIFTAAMQDVLKY